MAEPKKWDPKPGIVRRMEHLRELVDEGEITQAAFNREYGALTRQLIGDKEYRAAKRRIAKARPG